MESTGDAKNPVKCFLVCKVFLHKKIKVIQVYDSPKKVMEIFHYHYFLEEAKNFDIKIMHHNGNIITILSNGNENFIVE